MHNSSVPEVNRGQVCSLSAQVEMIVVKYLEEQGIDWRGDGEKKVNKRPHLGSGNEQE